MCPDTLVTYGHILQLLLGRVKPMRDAAGWEEILREFRIYAARFSVSLLHCLKVSARDALTHIRTIQNAVDFGPQDPTRISVFLLVVFSSQLGLAACLREVWSAKIGSAKQIAVMECVNKIQSMLGEAISPIFEQPHQHSANPLHAALRMPFRMADQLMVNEVMTTILLFLMANRALFTRELNKPKPPVVSNNCAQHSSECAQAVKTWAIQDAALRYLTQISVDLRKSLSLLPYNAAVSTWD
jgi:hypothetical protein